MIALRFLAIFAAICLCRCDNDLVLLQISAKALDGVVPVPRESAMQRDTPIADASNVTAASFAKVISSMSLQAPMAVLRTNGFRVLASRKRKLLFCSIFKNAATEFLSLMMRAEGLDEVHWNPGRHGVAEDSVHNDPARKVLLFERTSLSSVLQFNSIWNGSTPGWTRGIVLRDPVERLVSAWLSKVQTDASPLKHPVIPLNTSFENMVALLENYGDLADLNTDPHLRLQSVQCGLSEADGLEKFDVIGIMDNLAIDSREMLTLADGSEFADAMLSTGWGSDGAKPLFALPRSAREHGNGHAMESGGTHEILRSLSPVLVARVRKLYAADVELIERAKRIRATRRMSSKGAKGS